MSIKRSTGQFNLRSTESILTLSGLTEEEEELKQPETWRPRLDLWLNHLGVQIVVVVAVLIDLLVVTFLLLIDLSVIQDPNSESPENVTQTDEKKSDSVQTAEDVLHVIQLVFLSVFFVEITLRAIARGLDILEDKWQVFDSLIVLVAFTLYVTLTAAVDSRTVTYSIGFIIVFRLWRIGRVFHASREPVIRRAERIIIAHRKAWKQTEQRLKYAENTIEKQHREIQTLQDHVHKLQQLESGSRSSPSHYPHLSSYHSQPNLSTSAEDVTSDEETGLRSRATLEHQIHADISPNKGTTLNGSVPNGTPKGSMGSIPNGSLPGTPESTSSRLFGEGLSVASEGSAGRVPDIVEDAQSADIRLYENTVNCDAKNGDSVAPVGAGGTKEPGAKTETRDTKVSLGAGNQGHGHGHTAVRPHDSKDIETLPVHQDTESQHSNMDKDSGVSPDLENVDYVTYMSQGKINEIGAAPHPGTGSTEEEKPHPAPEKHRYLRERDKHDRRNRGHKKAYVNHGYEIDNEEHLTEEEKKEIRRVSQVPFGSSTYLLQEGIPMTDL